MPRLIEIDGGLVTLVDKTIVHSVPLEEWLPLIERRVPVSTPVLPTNTRALWWDQTDTRKKKLMLLIEREPQIINLNMELTVHRISIPWTRFFFYATTRGTATSTEWQLEDYRIYWAKNKYANPTALDMFPALVPNVYEDGRICFGATGANANQTLANRIDQILNEFYVSTFNHDLTIRRPNNWRGWRAWETMTERNPMGWMTWTDWDTRPQMSWTNACDNWQNIPDQRLLPMDSGDPIPEVPLGATFGRLNEWLLAMDPHTRRRLMLAVTAAELPDIGVSDTDFDDDETDDENENV